MVKRKPSVGDELTHEAANYVTCPNGHKIFVIWSPEMQRFGFTCDECEEHSIRAVSLQGVIEVIIVGKRLPHA